MKLVTAFLLVCASTAFASTIAVPGDYVTIGEAVYNSASGDVIEIQPGLYAESGIVVSHPIEIRCAVDAEVVTVFGDAESCCVSIANVMGQVRISDVVFENGSRGVELLGNSATELEFLRCGFVNNIEEGFYASIGLNDGASLIAADCRFNGNGDTGATVVHVPETLITDCEFAGNVDAGALFVFGDHEWNRVVVSDNVSSGRGGGAAFIFGSNVTLNEVVFDGNAASRGGGLYLANTDFCMVNDCVFVDNSASHGNDAAIFGDLSMTPEAVFHCCTIDETEVWVENGLVEFDYEGCSVGVESKSLSSVKGLFR